MRSGTGRLHVAEQSGAAWLALCGSLVTRPQSIGRAVSPAHLAELDDRVCAYCRAIGRAVALEQRRADEMAADAAACAMAASA